MVNQSRRRRALRLARAQDRRPPSRTRSRSESVVGLAYLSSCCSNFSDDWPSSWNGTRQSVSGGTRRSPRRCGRRVRAHYAWKRLGLGRWRERCLWVGGGEGRDPETDNVGLSCGGGNGGWTLAPADPQDRESTRLNSSR